MRTDAITIALCVLASAAGPATGCELTPPRVSALAIGTRGVTPEDLVTLRDIGPYDLERPRDEVFTLSPDKTRLAFQIRQADPGTNSYCLGMFVLDRHDPERLVQVDSGGDFLPLASPGWGFANTPPAGVPMVITPLWSSDGRWIAYLRRDNGSTQVWRARTDGSGAEQITHLTFDVEGFVWSADDRSIIVRGRPKIQEEEQRIEKQGRTGYHFDDRFLPRLSARPFVMEPAPSDYFDVALDTGVVRQAADAERALLDPTDVKSRPEGAAWSASDPAGDQAWSAALTTGDISSPTALHIRKPGKPDLVCTGDQCQGVEDAWFDPRSHDLIFLRRKRGHNEQEFFRWSDGAQAPVQVFRTENLFSSCTFDNESLICTEEEPTKPRRIVSLDLRTGSLAVLFDPNPEFSSLRIGSVRHLRWTNSFGIESFGDLTLPPDHKKGWKYPLIIVGYISQGFQRGGTGDEYPILALAEKGYAVLSYQTPPDIGFSKGAKSWQDLNRINRIDWMDYRNTASTIDAGIKAAAALGVVDESRLGLTGMSYGGSIAQFELVNSRKFKAAILSTCCEEESNATLLAGPGLYKTVHQMGYPGLTQDGAKFWMPMSFRLNASHVSTPLLLQVPDQELLATTEGVMSLMEAGQPVDMYVYPGETHVKWQPAHRLSVYRRSIQWFDFWLKGTEDQDPVDPGQYQRWQSFRTGASRSLSGSPGK